MWLVNFSAMATGNLSFGLFVIPMGDALGISRSQLGWAITARRIAAGVSSFFVGRLIDRYGPRVLIPASAAIIGVALIGVNRANAPWQVIALFGLVGITGLAASQNVMTSAPLAKWFQPEKGAGLGPGYHRSGHPWHLLPAHHLGAYRRSRLAHHPNRDGGGVHGSFHPAFDNISEEATGRHMPGG